MHIVNPVARSHRNLRHVSIKWSLSSDQSLALHATECDMVIITFDREVKRTHTQSHATARHAIRRLRTHDDNNDTATCQLQQSACLSLLVCLSVCLRLGQLVTCARRSGACGRSGTRSNPMLRRGQRPLLRRFVASDGACRSTVACAGRCRYFGGGGGGAGAFCT